MSNSRPVTIIGAGRVGSTLAQRIREKPGRCGIARCGGGVNMACRMFYLGVPCRLGSSGIESVLELSLTDAEVAALHASAESVRQNIEWARQMLAAVA